MATSKKKLQKQVYHYIAVLLQSAEPGLFVDDENEAIEIRNILEVERDKYLKKANINVEELKHVAQEIFI